MPSPAPAQHPGIVLTDVDIDFDPISSMTRYQLPYDIEISFLPTMRVIPIGDKGLRH